MANKSLCDFDVDGELKATSLDVNGNADISGNLTGLDNVTSTNFVIGGHTINDVDLNGEFVDSSEHLLTSAGAHDRFLRKTSHGTIGGTDVAFGTTTNWANNPEPGFYSTDYSGSSGLVFMTGDVGGSASSIGLEFSYQGSIKVHSNTDSSQWHTHSVWTENDFTKSSVLNSNVTLDTACDVGAITNQTLTSTNQTGLNVDTTSYARIILDATDNWSYMRFADQGTTTWDIASFNSGDLEWRPGGGVTNRMTYSSGGKLTVAGEVEAASLDINGNADISGNLTGVDAFTASGKIQGAELEGTSLDINGNGDVSGTLNVNGSLTTTGAGVNGNLYANRYFQNATGIPTNNLGAPTVTEMALFENQFTPKTTLANGYDDLADLTFFTRATGTTENDYAEVTSYSDDVKRKFLRTNNSGVIIPNGHNSFRVEFVARYYTFANAMVAYWSSDSHNTQVHVWKRRCDNNTWYQHTTSSTTVSSWPGHLYLPFSTIAWNEDNTTSSGHYNKIRIEFTPNWSGHETYGTRNITLNGMQIWGGYPSGKRTVHNYDQNGKLDLFKDIGLIDNGVATFGYGDDLKIYHDGSNSYISEVGAGDLIISADNDLTFKDGSGNIMANMNASNSVELMFGNSKKFETASVGVTVTGDINQGALYYQDTAAGRIGFNRNTTNGAIHDSNYNAFQFNGASASGVNGKLELQAYNSSGGYGGSLTFDKSANLNVGGHVAAGTGSPYADTGLHVSADDTSTNFSSTTPANASLIVSNSDVAYGIHMGSYSSGEGVIQVRRTNAATYYDLNIQPHGGQTTFGGEIEAASLDINGAATIDGTTTITSSSTAALKIVGGTGVDTTGSFVLRQNGDGAGNGIAITSSNATSHRLWKDASGNFNIGSSANSNAFKQDTTGNVTIEGTITSTGQITGTELEGTSLDINGNADISGATSIGSAIASNKYSVVTIQGRESHMFSFNGQADHTLTLNSGSYFQAEVIITAHQTNSGTYNNLYIRGIWSNNHTSHHWDEIENIGGLTASTFTITNGQNGSTAASGQLVIAHDYVSADFSNMTVNVIKHYGVLTHVIS